MIEQHSYTGDYTNRYKFNGKELDEETGFYYYGARYYNPKFSIWLSVDPLAEKFPAWSPYNYTMNNPINLIDPTGMSPEDGDDWYENKLTGEIRWFDDKRSDCSDPKGNDWTNISSEKELNIERNGKQITGSVSEKGKSWVFFWDVVKGTKKLAQDLIDSKKVKFGELHPSPSKPIYKDDNANAIDNIIDASNGKLVYTSVYGHAKGKQVELRQSLLVMLNKLAEKYTFSISEIAGAKHSFGSRHYAGIAVDITVINGKTADINNPFLKSFMQDAKDLGGTEVLGPPTVNHGNHVHIGMPRN